MNIDYKIIYEEGFQSGNVFNNLYWLNYPKETNEDDKIKARIYVDGCISKMKEKYV